MKHNRKEDPDQILKVNDNERDNSQAGSTLLKRLRRSKIEPSYKPKRAQNQQVSLINTSFQGNQIWRVINSTHSS